MSAGPRMVTGRWPEDGPRVRVTRSLFMTLPLFMTLRLFAAFMTGSVTQSERHTGFFSFPVDNPALVFRFPHSEHTAPTPPGD